MTVFWTELYIQHLRGLYWLLLTNYTEHPQPSLRARRRQLDILLYLPDQPDFSVNQNNNNTDFTYRYFFFLLLIILLI